MADFQYRFNLKSTFEEAEKVPDFVDDIQLEASLNDDEASNFKLLLSEAVDNAIQHGNEYDPDKNVGVEITISKSEIRACVTNEGKGFDPETAVSSDPLAEENLLNTSGRGLFLLEQLSDFMEFKDEGKTLHFAIHRK